MRNESSSGNAWENDRLLPHNNSIAWPNNGTGLTLQVLNALEDKWQIILSKAIRDWNEGTEIDGVAMEVEKVGVFDCEKERGVTKVCNGNFGDTKWRGVNEIVLSSDGKTILSSG